MDSIYIYKIYLLQLSSIEILSNIFPHPIFYYFFIAFTTKCAISDCKNPCGTAAKSIRALKGLYEIDKVFIGLKESEIESLKVCNAHYNKDHRRHNQQSRSGIHLTDRTCSVCNETIKTTKLQSCNYHSLTTSSNDLTVNRAISCCFFTEYCTKTSKVIENEHLYETVDIASQTASYICMKCKEPFVQMVKAKKRVWRTTTENQSVTLSNSQTCPFN